MFIMTAVGNIMKSDVVCAGLDFTLGNAIDLCEEKRIRHLPIVDENKQLVGLVTDRDLRYYVSPRVGTISENTADRESLERPIHLIMVHKVAVVSANTPLWEAAQIMLDNRVGCLPVINLGRHVVGILTTTDLIRYIAQAG
jgi:CBS domain-containing protein